MDPKGHKGEAIWWAKFDDPYSEFSIEINSFGYVSESVRDEGYKTPEEYVVKYEIGKNPKRTEHQGYYRFISMTLEEVRVIYLEKDADWGRCFQSLLFSFKKGEYLKHKIAYQIRSSSLFQLHSKRFFWCSALPNHVSQW